MFSLRPSDKRVRILDIDTECRPLSYLGMDYTSGEITALAWSWDDLDLVESLLLTADGRFLTDRGRRLPLKDTYEFVRQLLASADVVTGHYLRHHDLPLLNSAMLENGLAPLPQLLVSDTKCDLVRRKYLSASQENLAALLDLPEPKRHMTQTEWREANRLHTAEQLELTRQRVVGDVVQHKALRAAMIEQGILKPPRLWRG